MPVRISIGPRRSDVPWVHNIGVDKLKLMLVLKLIHLRNNIAGTTYLLLHALDPLWVSFLHVLLPKMLFFEQLCAVRNFAPPLVFIFLLDESAHLFLQSFFNSPSAQLSQIYILRFQNLHDLILKGLDPIIGPTQLLLRLRRSVAELLLRITFLYLTIFT